MHKNYYKLSKIFEFIGLNEVYWTSLNDNNLVCKKYWVFLLTLILACITL